MATNSPIKMSQFEGISNLYTGSYLIGIGINDNAQLINIRIPSDSASISLGKQRWVLPEVTSPSDTRGEEGSESYGTSGEYWIKTGGTWYQVNATSAGVITSSFQLTNGQGFSFNSTSNVTFGQVTSSVLLVSGSGVRVQSGGLLINNGGAKISGSLEAFSGISGSLLGTASYSIFSNTSSYSDKSFTSSYSLKSNTASYSDFTSTASYVLTSNSASYALRATTSSYTLQTITSSYSITASYALSVKSNEYFNVKDYGAKGDDSTDDTTAFNNTIAAIPSSGGTLYIPSGTYLLNNLTAFSGKPISVIGENRVSTKLKCTSSTGQMFSFLSMDGVIKNLTFTSNVARNELTPLISVQNCTFFQLENISSNASGDLIYSEGGNWFFASDVFVRSDAALGGIAIHSKGQSLIFNNVILSNNNTSNIVKYPVLWIEGANSTGMKISNCSFSGGGPLYRYTGTSISSVADKFTITFPSTHDFGINEYVIISGSGASQYHNHWKVAATTSNTIVISSSLNLGSFSPNLVHSIPCNAVITNKYGAINESEMIGVMFEAVGYPVDSLSCGLFIDGTKSNSNISGWKFTSCYFDYGKIGALAVGGGTTGYNTTTARLLFSSTQCETPYQGIAIQQVPGVIIDGLQGPMYLVNSDPGNCGIYLYSNPYGDGLRGVQISNCSLGGDQSWQERTIYTRDYGIIIDGNIDGLTLNNNIIWGLSGSVKIENNTTLGSSNIKSSNNLFYSGSADPLTAITIPSIPSSATINIPWNDQIVLTGTTNISTINGGWKSREVQFIVNSGLTFNTGGNIATSKAVSAGTVARLIYDGTNWRHFS